MANLSHCFVSVSSLFGINAVELRDALTTNSNVTRGERIKISFINNQINARSLIGQSAMVYCAGKLMEKLKTI